MQYTNPLLARVFNKLSTYQSAMSLPLKFWAYRLSKDQEIEIVRLADIIKYCQKKRMAVDIGANVGYYTYPLSKIFSSVHSFEINDHTSRPIASYKSKNINLHNVGLSDTTSRVSLFTPVKNGRELNGWASLEKRDLDWIDSYNEKECKVMPLDEVGLSGVDFIKIDVEGHELNVISGAINLLKQDKPLLLIESEGEKYGQLTSLLESIGYKEVGLNQITGFTGSPQNHIYFHKETLAQFPNIKISA